MLLEGGVEGKPVPVGIFPDKFERRLSDFSGRGVDDAFESQVVISGYQPEVAQAVLYLGPFEEADTAPHHIRHIVAYEFLLDGAGEMGCAEKDGKVCI